MELAPIEKKYNRIMERIEDARNIKWTNKYDCPPAYSFNKDGWVQTIIPFPKISINFLPHLVKRLGEFELLLQNLLALRLLNDKPHAVLVEALCNRYAQAFFGRSVDKEVLRRVVKVSEGINAYTELPVFSEDIVKFDTIWYSKECSLNGRFEIKQLLRNNYISNIREMMPINKKYVTKEVMTEADVTRYAITQYWDINDLTAKNRTAAAIVEAMQEILDSGRDLTKSELALLSGVSIRTIQRYKELTNNMIDAL